MEKTQFPEPLIQLTALGERSTFRVGNQNEVTEAVGPLRGAAVAESDFAREGSPEMRPFSLLVEKLQDGL